MRPPEGLDAAGRAAFRRAVATLAELGEPPELSADAVHAYALAVSEARTLEREWRKLGASGVREGPRGGVYEEPLLRAIDRAQRRAGELAGELGLTPAARRKLGHAVRGGRSPGAASAPDRAARPPRWQLKAVEPGA
jgi:P27 family predicted phage terminase small subunit